MPSAAMVTVAAPSVFGPNSSGCRDRWRGAARVQARCREAAWPEAGGRDGCLDGRWWVAWEACGSRLAAGLMMAARWNGDESVAEEDDGSLGEALVQLD